MEECKYCQGAVALANGPTNDSGIAIHYPNKLIAYGYDIHGFGNNGIEKIINFCPMCGRPLGPVSDEHLNQLYRQIIEELSERDKQDGKGFGGFLHTIPDYNTWKQNKEKKASLKRFLNSIWGINKLKSTRSIPEICKELEHTYGHRTEFGMSYSTLFNDALDDGFITISEYCDALIYYGSNWDKDIEIKNEKGGI